LPRGRPKSAGADGGAEVRLPVGFETLTVGYSDLHTLAEEIVRYGADAVVLEPPELRSRVLAMLGRVAHGAERDVDRDHDEERASA
jgi:proteasome accessory factor B